MNKNIELQFLLFYEQYQLDWLIIDIIRKKGKEKDIFFLDLIKRYIPISYN